MNTHVLWSDEEFKTGNNSVIVLVDTLRASSVIPVALCSGANKVIVVKEADTARGLKVQNPDGILAGERSGLVLEGFDCGNSPVAMAKMVEGKDVVLTTGNFCKVIDAIAEKGVPIIAASFVNATACAEYLKSYEKAYFVATGTYHMHGKRYDKPVRTEEDSITCWYIAQKIGANAPGRYRGALDDISKFVWRTQYAKYLLELDEKNGDDRNRRDIEACLEVGKYPCVPILEGNEFRL